jgi:hypothetical protein
MVNLSMSLGAKHILITVIAVIVISNLQTKDRLDTLSRCEMVYDTLTQKSVYKVVDEMPVVEGGGMNTLYKLISKTVTFKETTKMLYDSKVFVGFIVDKKGQLRGKRIIKNIQYSTAGEQILNVVAQVNWISGKCNGEPVDVLYVLSVIFHFDH